MSYGDNYEELEPGVEPEPLVFEEGKDYRKWELEQLADTMLREDSRRELCRQCDEYGSETGNIESQPQYNEDGTPLVDETAQQLYVDFPELQCSNGHIWYKGEGKARGNGGKNPVLFEEHLKNRQRREIYTTIGTPDPSIVQGMFNRTHPQGRKVNSADQRKRHGASFYRAYDITLPLILLGTTPNVWILLGALCLLMLNARLLRQHTCENTTLAPRIAKRSVRKTANTLPPIAELVAPGLGNGTLRTNR